MFIILLCALLIKDVPRLEGEQQRQISLKRALMTKEFYMLLVSFTFTVVGPLYIVQKYKEIAQYLEIMNDKLLAVLGSTGAIFASCCKIVFGHLIDVYGFKIVYFMMIGLIFVVGIGINIEIANSFAFSIYVCISYVSLGGHQTILAPISRRLYGNVTGMMVFGFLFFTIGFGTILAFFAAIIQGNIENFAITCTSLSGLAFVSLITIIFFKDEPILQGEDMTPLLENNKNNADS